MFATDSKTFHQSNSIEARLSLLVTEPIYWLMLALFLNISGVTDYFRPLQSLETVVFAIGMATAGLRFFLNFVTKNEDELLADLHPLFAALGFGIVSCSIFSTFIN